MTNNDNDTGAGAPPPPEPRRIAPRSPRTALEPERVPPPVRRRSDKARHPVVVVGNAIFTLLVLVTIVIGGVLWVGNSRLTTPGPLAEDKVVLVPRGLGLRDIADLLVSEGVIDQPLTFVGAVLVQKARDDLKSGEYMFQKQATLEDVIGTLKDGKVVQHSLTLAEGLTSEQIVAKLLETDFLAGNIREIPREGSLLPETYKVVRGTSRDQVIKRMQQAQRSVLQDVWERRVADLPLRTPDQLVVLASIIEKETGIPEERTRIAAVFVNRLKQRMRLQSDPTIIYGLVGGKGTLGRPIMKSEIEQPTPYNTYVIDGLPPGPIANPGRAALEAAANPARTRELYFVADGSGGHAFAENFSQHQRNVAKLRALEQSQRDGAQASPGATPAADDAEDTASTTPARRSDRGNGSTRAR
ncbi:protein YceG [Rhodovulum sp. PH10]|uniref:endolytic transglycosylase MltG n=1 Tax=Rhodovulum sp. PH10 TaxID=1187851 RepID=UPI00027C236C|nr:endolytic transglycosylase MltG [Rhodovulum sp. PH10]EJW11883.1 protein YceG [Rhodovulum sp. PH10]